MLNHVRMRSSEEFIGGIQVAYRATYGRKILDIKTAAAKF